MASPFFKVIPVRPVLRDQCEITMRLYLHQVVTGPNHNQETMVPSSHPASFGMIVINDWPIYDGPDFNTSTIVAHARGMHVQVDQVNNTWYTSMNVEFVDDRFLWRIIILKWYRFNGSKLQVMGTTPETGEWAIVGGTGQLAIAYGTIQHNIVKNNPGIEATRQLDIHAFYSTPQTQADVMTTTNTIGQQAE
uniref:Dirigent protein n=1 Tax=Oryza barthii TaxID=65489 RepID=A0A0D3HCE1_9ORYZ